MTEDRLAALARAIFTLAAAISALVVVGAGTAVLAGLWLRIVVEVAGL